MFTKKPSKREEQKKDKVIWYSQSSFPKEYWSYNECFRVISIDPGIVNFCIRVEDRYRNGIVKTIWTEKKVLDGNDGHVITVYNNLTGYLNSLRDIICNGHYYIIERQMVENYQSTRIAQHVLTYFLTLFSSSPIMPLILEIDSKAKYSELDAPTGFNQNALKKWGQQKAKEILLERGETELVDYINGSRGIRAQKKQDDLCDVIIQSEAFFKLYPIS